MSVDVLSKQNPDNTQNIEKSQPSARFCSECGKPIAQNMSFCPNCGAKLFSTVTPITNDLISSAANPNETFISSNSKATKLTLKHKPIIISAMAIIAIAIIATIGITIFKPSHEIVPEDPLNEEDTEHFVTDPKEVAEEMKYTEEITQTNDEKAPPYKPVIDEVNSTDWVYSHLTRINEIMNDSVFLPYGDNDVAFTDFDRFYDDVHVYFALIDINNDSIDELVVSATNNNLMQYGQLYLPASTYEAACIPETGFSYYDSDNHIVISEKENQITFYEFNGQNIKKVKEYKIENGKCTCFDGSDTTTISQKEYDSCLADNGITDKNRISGLQMTMENIKNTFGVDITPDGRDWHVSSGTDSADIHFNGNIVASYADRKSESENETKVQNILKECTDEYYVSSVFCDLDKDGSAETLALSVPTKVDMENECDSGVTASLWYIKDNICENLFYDRDAVGLELNSGTFSDGTVCFISYEFGVDGRVMDTVFWIKSGNKIKELQHLTGGEINSDGNVAATTYGYGEDGMHLVTNCYKYNSGSFTLYDTFITELY